MLHYIIIVFYIFIKLIDASSIDSFFSSCDIDNSKILSEAEFRNCIKLFPGFSEFSSQAIDNLIGVIDIDNDGSISLSEYKKMMTNFRDSKGDSTVTLTNRYGETETITINELYSRSESTFDGMQRENGQIFQEKTGSSNLDSLSLERPDMARFISFGKWAQLEMQLAGYAYGSISQIRSLPYGGSINRGNELSEDIYNQFGNFTVWFEMSIQTNISDSNGRPTTDNKKKSNEIDLQYFEVEIERDRHEYVKPYLALKNAWELDDKGKRIKQLKIKHPRYRFLSFKTFERTIEYGVKAILTIITIFVLSKNFEIIKNPQ